MLREYIKALAITLAEGSALSFLFLVYRGLLYTLRYCRYELLLPRRCEDCGSDILLSSSAAGATGFDCPPPAVETAGALH